MSGYIGTQPVPQATQTRDAFTATSGQTSFATSGYTPSFLDVFLNGVKLSAADYTASNGSDVVLASGAATGDILEVVAYTTFEVVTDTVTNAGTVLNLDRTGSDGTILDLKKNGSTVGSIGTSGGDAYFGTGDTGIIAYDNGNAILPFNTATGAYADNSLDFGVATQRFKDLYLSGGVYLGGTGSANKLDDYEEGTTSVQLRGSTEPATLLTATMYWAKINDRVSFQLGFENVNTTGYAGSVTISGLPFANTSGPRAVLSVGTYNGFTWSDTLFAYIGISGTTIEIMDIRSGTTWLPADHNAGLSRYIWVTGIYKN